MAAGDRHLFRLVRGGDGFVPHAQREVDVAQCAQGLQVHQPGDAVPFDPRHAVLELGHGLDVRALGAAGFGFHQVAGSDVRRAVQPLAHRAGPVTCGLGLAIPAQEQQGLMAPQQRIRQQRIVTGVPRQRQQPVSRFQNVLRRLAVVGAVDGIGLRRRLLAAQAVHHRLVVAVRIHRAALPRRPPTAQRSTQSMTLITFSATSSINNSSCLAFDPARIESAA